MNMAPLKPLLSLEIFHFVIGETKAFRLQILFDSCKDMVMKCYETSFIFMTWNFQIIWIYLEIRL